jgi:wyosine [tRNA(Phe)-imidazoG37] synthetase (radical SAM superfamily)
MNKPSPAVFGPVPSRRLGLSLGIDLLEFKTCSLDCLYCELGLTTCLTALRGRWRDYRQVAAQVGRRLGQLSQPPDCLTISGSGEPTLHLDLGLLLEELGQLSPLRRVVLTNSTLLHDPQVRRDLARADLLVPSLDAVSPQVFAALNRPAPGLDPPKMIQGLMDLRQEFSGPIWLEILLVAGINDQESELDKLRRAAAAIQPDLIQLNTITRPPALPGAAPLEPERLAALAASFALPSQAIAPSQARGAQEQGPARQREDIIAQTIAMRPCTIPDLLQASGLSLPELEAILQSLGRQERVEIEDYQGRRYYRGKT